MAAQAAKGRRLIRGVYWQMRRLIAHAAGTSQQERFWSRRHERGGNDWGSARHTGDEGEWIKSYWDSYSHPHRALLMKTISAAAPVESVLELGCNCGPNLYRLSSSLPGCRLTGVDINSAAVKWGRARFREEGMSNVSLLVGSIDRLAEFSDRSFDVVFTDAVLLYVGPDKIEAVAGEVFRLARKSVVLVEWHTNEETRKARLGVYHYGGWLRNYRALIRTAAMDRWDIVVDKIPPEVWPSTHWMAFGCIVQARRPA